MGEKKIVEGRKLYGRRKIVRATKEGNWRGRKVIGGGR